MRGAVLHARPVEQVHQRHTGPDGIADQASADRVRHARQRDHMLLEVHRQDVVEGQLVGPVDHAGEAELPVGRIDLRHGQRCVDAVEAVVGRDVARNAGDLVERVECGHLSTHRARRCGGGAGRRGLLDGRSSSGGGRGDAAQVDGGACGLSRGRTAHGASQRHKTECSHARAADAHQKCPAALIGRLGPTLRLAGSVICAVARHGVGVGRSGRETQQQSQREVAERGGAQGHDPRPHERAHRVASGGPAADGAERGEPGERHPALPRRHGACAQQAADDQRHADDADRQHRLVLLAEQLDAQPHRPVRRVVHERLADGDDQRRNRVDRAVDEFAERQRHRRAGHARQQPSGAAPAYDKPAVHHRRHANAATRAQGLRFCCGAPHARCCGLEL